MKHLTALLLAIILAFSTLFKVSAQAAETIWMETSQGSYSASETITISLHINTTAAFQGFTFQLRYDPACLQPVAQTSLLPGLNSMGIPQTAGLVDAIFASTSPLSANGLIAEVKFNALAGCQTPIVLESATLVVSDASGMAVPLQGITLGTSTLVLNVGGPEAGAPQPTSAPEGNPTPAPDSNPAPGTGQAPITKPLGWLSVVLLVLVSAFLFILLIIAAGFISRMGRSQPAAATALKQPPSLYIQRGLQAGRTLPLLVFPCRLGSDPESEICLSDPRIAGMHARIIAGSNGYYLVDLGSQEGTYLNGKLMIQNQPMPLKRGDALRLGRVLLVFNLG